MANKFKSMVVFGRNAVDIANECKSPQYARRKIRESGDGDIVTRLWKTKEEREAYLKGIDDAGGWLYWDTFFYSKWDK